MEALLLLIMGVVNVLCFIVGAKVGQKSAKGEEIELPSVNPLKAVREHQEKRMAEMEQDARSRLVEHHLISYDLLKYASRSAAMVSSAGTVSVPKSTESGITMA